MEIVAARLQKLWNVVELQFLVLLSLFIQIVLIFLGNRRKYNKRKWLAFFLWLSYLSADAVATLALGVLSQADGDSKNAADPKRTITVFWAPFLLMHLGGPDTITAYAMADNELWSRHLLSLLGQVSIAVYIFLRSFSGADLNIWWILIFSAGVVKYGERSWVLFTASKDRYRDSLVSRPDGGPNYAKFVDDAASKVEEGYKVSLGKAIDVIPTLPRVVGRADGDYERIATVLPKSYFFFKTFKKLFADLILSFQDREISVSYFENLRWDDAFLIVEVELGLVYDLFYTKLPLVFSPTGIFLRLFSCTSTITMSVAFLFMKSGYPQKEVIITFILLGGAVFLEIYAIVILFLSDRMMIWLKWGWTTQPQSEIPKFISLLYSLHVVPARRRWSNSIGQYNLFEHCLKYLPNPNKVQWYPKWIDEFIMKFRQNLLWKSEQVEPDLKELVFGKVLKERAKENERRKVDSYWIDRHLRQTSCFDENDEVEFDQSVLLWHMATDICYHTTNVNADDESKRGRCILLSNYMVHLLITSPFMLPSGIGQIRFQDTCMEATEFLDNEMGLQVKDVCEMLSKVKACFRPSEVKGDRSKSLLFDACRLADYLKNLGNGQTWETITEAWVDMLLFAAAQCSWSDHAEKLSQGGELLTHVWLLMAHFGMTDQFQISQGYIRAKLQLK